MTFPNNINKFIIYWRLTLASKFECLALGQNIKKYWEQS